LASAAASFPSGVASQRANTHAQLASNHKYGYYSTVIDGRRELYPSVLNGDAHHSVSEGEPRMTVGFKD
jgi:hypothetical protein